MNKYRLTLFITGHTPRSERALANLRAICKEFLGGDHIDLTVVDVLDQPELAERERVLTTPLLLKRVPPPTRRIIGDLSDREKVIWGLGLASAAQVGPRRG